MWRNKKANEKRERDFENERARKFEKLQDSVQRDLFEEELNEADSSTTLTTNNNNTNVTDITCPEMLYQLYRKSSDPDNFHELLTASQSTALADYHHNLSTKKQNEISRKIYENMENCERNVTPLLTLLVADVYRDSKKLYYFHVWKPTDGHLGLLKEGSIVNVYSLVQKYSKQG